MFSCKSLTSKGFTANFALQYACKRYHESFPDKTAFSIFDGFWFSNCIRNDWKYNSVFFGNPFQVEVLGDFCKVGAAGHSSALAGVDFCVSQPLFHFQGMGFPLIAFFFLADSMS